jgi:hypothetical protein
MANFVAYGMPVEILWFRDCLDVARIIFSKCSHSHIVTAACRYSPQELIQGFESPGGGTDADDGKRLARGQRVSFRANSWNGLFLPA